MHMYVPKMKASSFAVLASAMLCLAAGKGLVDDPLHGAMNELQYLDGEAWTATGPAAGGKTVTIGATVPGDLITDLQVAGLIGDPLYDLNWMSNTFWDAGNWSYWTNFDLSPALLQQAQAGAAVWLVFDSLKMAGDVFVNGQHVMEFADQFLRYNVSLGSLTSGVVKATGNTLQVVFTTSADTRNFDGRWMGCTGGWDWAPYSTTFTAQGDHTFSKGIVRSVYLVPVQAVALAHVVPRIYYTGGYEQTPLVGRQAAPFSVQVDVILYSSAPTSVSITALGAWAVGTPITVTTALAVGENKVTLTLPNATNVQLWWPLGMGTQTLYSISVNVTSSPTPDWYASTTRHVGFRLAHLVTVDDTVPNPWAVYGSANGSGNRTMRFKVNGANVWSRGGNMIPVEEMEGRQSEATYTALLYSAAAAGHNTLRVWGGGIYLPSIFYDECDRLGIMVYHDLMFGTPWNGGSGGKPQPSDKETDETIHSVRRLTAHPSIVLWDTGNEDLGRWDDSITGYLLPTVTSVDDTRAVWPTSPSYGLSSGVNRLTGLPNGQPFALPSTGGSNPGWTFETHGPYQHGAGFKTVNGDGNIDLFPTNLPPNLLAWNAAYGAAASGTYASEFGCSVFSSFESMAPTLPPSAWSAHSEQMVQRNYPTDNIVQVYFGAAAAAQLNETGTFALQRATYLATLGSAIQQKSDNEVRRSGNAYGTITWQLGEIWPTGGWGSLEYATVGYTPGQVLGGRWKPLHHWMATHLYKDQMIACGVSQGSAAGYCVIKNDNGLNAWSGVWKTELIRVSDGAVLPLASVPVSLPAGANAAQWVCPDNKGTPSSGCSTWSSILSASGCAADASNCVLRASLLAAGSGAVVDSSITLLTSLGNMTAAVQPAAVTATVGAMNPDGSIPVTVSSTAPALYVTLVSATEQGHFSDNAFLVLPEEPVTVTFLPMPMAQPLPTPQKLQSTLRVDHVGLYL